MQGTSDIFPAPGYLGQGRLSKAWKRQNCNWQFFGNENRLRGIPSHPRFSILYVGFRAGSTAEQEERVPRDEGGRG